MPSAFMIPNYQQSKWKRINYLWHALSKEKPDGKSACKSHEIMLF